jgi:AcrR family transcriptional regulator
MEQTMITSTSAPAETLLRRDAVENRKKLIDAARTVFAQHGLEAGVDEVAQAAGVGIGTLYRRFPTKDALVGELVRELLEEFLARARTAESVPHGRGLEQFLYASGEAQEANRGCLPRLWNDETTVPLRAECRRRMAELLTHAQEHGEIRRDATLSDLDLLFCSMRGIFESAGDTAGCMWRRQTALTIAGLRPARHEIGAPPVTPEHMAQVHNPGYTFESPDSGGRPN